MDRLGLGADGPNTQAPERTGRETELPKKRAEAEVKKQKPIQAHLDKL